MQLNVRLVALLVLSFILGFISSEFGFVSFGLRPSRSARKARLSPRGPAFPLLT